jgi:hypothetical protein
MQHHFSHKEAQKAHKAESTVLGVNGGARL